MWNQLLGVCPILLLKALFGSSKKLFSTPNLKSLLEGTYFLWESFIRQYFSVAYIPSCCCHTLWQILVRISLLRYFQWLCFLELFYKCSGKQTCRGTVIWKRWSWVNIKEPPPTSLYREKQHWARQFWKKYVCARVAVCLCGCVHSGLFLLLRKSLFRSLPENTLQINVFK